MKCIDYQFRNEFGRCANFVFQESMETVDLQQKAREKAGLSEQAVLQYEEDSNSFMEKVKKTNPEGYAAYIKKQKEAFESGGKLDEKEKKDLAADFQRLVKAVSF